MPVYAKAKRPIVGHPIPLRLDFLELSLIDSTDLAEAIALVNSHGKKVLFDNTPPESTLESPPQAIHYRVVDGILISEHLPKFKTLYQEIIPQLILDHIGLEMCPSRFERSSITLNLIEGRGARYELHVDSNSITGLLFAHTLDGEDGGALRFFYPDRAAIDIQPEAGVFLLFDARWVPHEVVSLNKDVQRLSIPMNYYLPTDIETRPDHLDSYIFGDNE